ncbi:hypothetical protein BDR03DRAFT_971695 [Suillus americanus]|nr:hypothetical protein BDR03DRAFT_971695 [Suillus americanus]
MCDWNDKSGTKLRKPLPSYQLYYVPKLNHTVYWIIALLPFNGPAFVLGSWSGVSATVCLRVASKAKSTMLRRRPKDTEWLTKLRCYLA